MIRGVPREDAPRVRQARAVLPLLALVLGAGCAATAPRRTLARRAGQAKQDAGVPPADCADHARAERAVAFALDHAVAAGVSRDVLDGCAFAASRCGDAPDEEPEGAPRGAPACVVAVDVSYGLWRVEIRPAARDGAPRWLEVTLDAALTLPPARTWISASTTALAPRRRVVVRGEDQRRSHAHGGEPATVGGARFSIRNDGPAPLRVAVRRVEWLTSPSCDGPFEVRATPRVAGLAIDDGPTERSVRVPTGDSSVEVEFEAQPAYYAYCDRFAARVTFDVEGEAVRASAEWLIARREPLSRR